MLNNLKQLRSFQLSRDEVLIEVDPQYFRPTEVEMLLGDRSKAEENLGWKPKYKLDELVKNMVVSDLEEIETAVTSEKIKTN
jgi:GDPmannose 4,6-dehydratase